MTRARDILPAPLHICNTLLNEVSSVSAHFCVGSARATTILPVASRTYPSLSPLYSGVVQGWEMCVLT
jgi:hypothetical protein